MSNFEELMNQPLPSKVEESADILNNFNAKDALLAIESEIDEKSFNAKDALLAIESEIDNALNDVDTTEGCDTAAGTVEEADDEDAIDLGSDEDDFDIDDLDDAELAALNAELGGDELDDVVGDEEEEELTPEEEIEADDMMKVAATTMLVNDELSVEERVAFLSNEAEIKTAIAEGFVTEADVNTLALEAGLVQEAKYTNKMIIKLDANSKKKQLYALAVNVSAAAHGDKDYIKLKKVMKMRKILRARLAKKYHTEATKRMKIYFKRLRNSKSPVLSKIGNKENK